MANELKLTKKRAKWAKNRKTILKGSKLNYNAGVQARYLASLENLTLQMALETNKKVMKLFRGKSADEFFESQAMDASISSQARILMNYLTRSFSQLFESKATIFAKRMLSGTTRASSFNVHESLKELSGGLSLKTSIVTEGQEEIAKALIAENVSYIKSIPEQYFKDVTGSVMRSITTGRGLADLIPDLEKYEGQTARRAKNIALDQTRKAYNAISREKLTNLGVKQFEWGHTGGSLHPRDSHLKINGKIFSLDPILIEKEQEALGVPENDRGFPGIPVNCRCYMRPIITFGDEEGV